jgi:hypothetical protein
MLCLVNWHCEDVQQIYGAHATLHGNLLTARKEQLDKVRAFYIKIAHTGYSTIYGVSNLLVFLFCVKSGFNKAQQTDWNLTH